MIAFLPTIGLTWLPISVVLIGTVEKARTLSLRTVRVLTQGGERGKAISTYAGHDKGAHIASSSLPPPHLHSPWLLNLDVSQKSLMGLLKNPR
jgi:hypothetical protein